MTRQLREDIPLLELAGRVDAILRDVRTVRHSWDSAVSLFAAWGQGLTKNAVLPQKICDSEGVSRCRRCGAERVVPVGAPPPVVCGEADCNSFDLVWVVRPSFSFDFPRGGPARKYTALDFYADMGSFFQYSTELRARKTRSKLFHGRELARWIYCRELSTYTVASGYRETWGVPVSAEAIRRLALFWEESFTAGGKRAALRRERA